ncbi:signal transduction histidine kinase [Xenococcus sp. PCC 7305]|uniref:sensor histidine kinase n=1 Tax=Xenococcus sp. PCC 7305 TaxID=102125 RepID=UPI0002AC987D|nr:ATP-binding protein [Xenococcus sp. PCC 7305]ELS04411.1 signal transduction histidine kinase [Xenococcus sp. PCC 7305]
MSLGKPSSFRRILLSRLFFLSVPILLTGVYITYSKARSTFMESARQNLTESAIRKGESIRQSVNEVYANLIIASDLEILKSDSATNTLIVISRLTQILPESILCVHLNDPKSLKIIASNCDESPNLDYNAWPQQKQSFFTPRQQIQVDVIHPPKKTAKTLKTSNLESQNQVKLWLTAPVYDLDNQLRYTLTVKSAILNEESRKPGSLDGYPVIVNEEGSILNHLLPEIIEQNIQPILNSKTSEKILNLEDIRRIDSERPFVSEQEGLEFLVGYNTIPNPINPETSQRWLILSVTPLSDALCPLRDIRRVLVVMTVGLITVTFFATLYMSRELALPLENIRDYALKKEDLQSKEDTIENFRIKEFNQLSLAINAMVTRLRTKGDEIVSAWQEAKSANQLKSEFLATTSHELRTPLNGIINCIRLVKDGYCDSKDEEKEFLQQADHAAIHLLEIINDVLDISKIEAGKISVDIQDVNLEKVINDVISMQIAAIRGKGLNLVFLNWPQRIHVRADPAKLKQVFLNILGNAVKFTDAGTIEIQVLVRLKENPFSNKNNSVIKKDINQALDSKIANCQTVEMKQNELVSNAYFSSAAKEAVIVVRDTGIGIELDQQDKLFRPFVMADGSTTRKFGGTGLGLAISHNLLQLMKGTISLSSPGQGQGTTITITLPLGRLGNMAL